MARHVAYKPTLAKRTLAPMAEVTSKAMTWHPIRRILATKTRKSLGGFLFTSGLVAVSIVDPYSGAMANIMQQAYLQQMEEGTGDQVYGWKTTQTISFERGGFKVVTGKNAASLFVELAAVPDAGSVKAYAYSQVLQHGWQRDQYSCLVKLWDRESNWRHTATNRSSGAYGIPQALPGIKMASAGADWMTNPETQIRWGLGYIEGRYGSPCGALAHSDKLGWY
ncbi:MAG: lytic transglycosylase domain-containing protein [Microbacteriaceae bacterium]